MFKKVVYGLGLPVGKPSVMIPITAEASTEEELTKNGFSYEAMKDSLYAEYMEKSVMCRKRPTGTGFEYGRIVGKDMIVSIYLDSFLLYDDLVDIFGEDTLEHRDNLLDLIVPEQYVHEWYEVSLAYEKNALEWLKSDCCNHEPSTRSFDEWYDDTIADDFDGFFDYLKNHCYKVGIKDPAAEKLVEAFYKIAPFYKPLNIVYVVKGGEHNV